jgi:hypothetical protein
MKRLFLVLGILAFLGVPFVNATVEVRIVNTGTGGGDTGWIICAGTSCSTGTIAVGNYDIVSNIAIQDNGANPILDVSYDAHTTDSTPGTLIFEAIANGYTLNTPETLIHGSGNSTLGDMITFASYGENNNTTCTTTACTPATNGASLASIGPLNDNAGFNSSTTGAGNTVNPYEVGVLITLNSPTNAGGASGDIQLNAVPEPASVMLLGGVLLFAAAGLRRRTRKA